VPWLPLRQIVEEASFEVDKRRISPDAKRLDEILEAVCLRLSQAAESGEPIGSDLYVVLTTAFPDAPALGVTYRFDAEHVYLLGIELD
jgi:hypothetical protein